MYLILAAASPGRFVIKRLYWCCHISQRNTVPNCRESLYSNQHYRIQPVRPFRLRLGFLIVSFYSVVHVQLPRRLDQDLAKITQVNVTSSCPLLRPHLLQLLRAMDELVCICFWDYPSLVRLLHEVFVSLLVGKSNCIIF